MQFNDWVKNLLHEKRLTYKELGELVGVSGGAVGGWVRSEFLPDPTSLRRLAEVAEVTPLWLFQLVGYLPTDEGAQAQEHDPLLLKLHKQLKQLSVGERQALSALLAEMIKNHKK